MEKHFKQLIIARRDLNMSPGKLAAQVSHASSAFLIEMIRDSWPEKVQDFYQVNYRLDKDVYDNWINDGVTKVVIFQILYSPFLGYLNITIWFLIGCFRNSKTKMVFEILMAWENEFVKIFTLFPEIHAPVLSYFITLKHYS